MSNDSPNAPDPIEPLPYASPAETSLLLRAYSCVGWYFLISGLASALGSIANIVVLTFTTPARIAGLSQLTYAAPMAVVAIGGIGMIVREKWGAYVLIGAAIFRTLVAGAGMSMYIAQPRTLALYYNLTSSATQALQAFATAVVAYLLLHLCKDSNAFNQ